MTTDLVVADPERSENTICLAVSAHLKKRGVQNRCRIKDIPSSLKYIIAQPRMQLYIDCAAEIYGVFLKYLAPEDIYVYSIDESFLDVTPYLKMYGLPTKELAKKIMQDVKDTVGTICTCGIGTNLYLAKIALDLTAKHAEDFIGELDEESYREKLWDHKPITDFWRISHGTEARLKRYGISTMRKRPPNRKEAFTAEEVKLLLENLPEDQVGWGIRLMLCTGMRTQELLGLEPRHIAEDGSTITIEQAVVMEKGTAVIGPPKSFDSYRTVPVPRNVQYCARMLRAVETKYVWEKGKVDMPCNPSYFRKKFKEEISSVEGVRVLTPHSCRHTYVSQMQALGVDLATIQSLVGHADVDMTKHYLHVQDPVRLTAIAKFNSAFFGNDDENHPNIIEFYKSS